MSDGFHYYGMGTSAGYQTVWCSPEIEPIKYRIASMLLSLSGRDFLKRGADDLPVTLCSLPDNQVLISQWRPPEAADYRGRSGGADASSCLCSMSRLERTGYDIQAFLTVLSSLRGAPPSTPPALPTGAKPSQQATRTELAHLRALLEQRRGRWDMALFTYPTWLPLIPSGWGNWVTILNGASIEIELQGAPPPAGTTRLLLKELARCPTRAMQLQIVNDWPGHYRRLVVRRTNRILKWVFTCCAIGALMVGLWFGYSYASRIVWPRISSWWNGPVKVQDEKKPETGPLNEVHEKKT